MKKFAPFFILLFVLATLLPNAEAFAAPPPETPAFDATWLCVGGYLYGTTCPSPDNGMSPYKKEGEFGHSYSLPTIGLTAAKISCSPSPDCINDFGVYYQVSFTSTWTRSTFTEGYPNPVMQDVGVYLWGQSEGGTDEKDTFECGSGLSGYCEGKIYGMIDAASIPEQSANYTVLALEHIHGIQNYTFTYKVFFSLRPFQEDCLSKFFVPSMTTYLIDPLIEEPKGEHAVEPDLPDFQLQETVVDQVYMISTDGGPWDDGETEDGRYDTAISWDGVTYTPLGQVEALCVDWEPDYPDLRDVFVVAQSDTLYIRVNDLGGQVPSAFDDNAQVGELTYTFGLAIDVMGQTCESQFTYDPVADLHADYTLQSTAQDSFTEDYVYGDWYGIEVVNGTTWHETDLLPRTDLEFIFTGNTDSTWEGFAPLTEGQALVWCVSQEGKAVVFVQANNPILHLRVHDQNNNFSDNTGDLDINIYHVAFNRTPDICETQFTLGDNVASSIVDAKQVNGEQFAYAPSDPGSVVYPPYSPSDWQLVPGAWYALETTEGPWAYQGALHSDLARSYDMAVNTGDVSWTTLDQWTYPVCNVRVDGFGHRLIYFQMPNPDAPDYEGAPWITGTDINWLIRVADTSSWSSNIGHMGFDLYRVDNNFTNSSDCGGFTTENSSIFDGFVDAKNEDGVYVPDLQPDTVYKIVIETSTGGWKEDPEAEESDDMQLSYKAVALDETDTTWMDLTAESSIGVVCHDTTEDGDLAIVVKTGSMPVVKLRVKSTSFSNNSGGEYFKVYRDTLAPTPCEETIQGLGGLQVIEPHGPIPVTEETGTLVTSEYNYAEATGLLPDMSGGSTEFNGTSNGWYVIEIEFGSGPWYTNTADYLTGANGHHSAQLSKDAGATWFNMLDSGTGGNVSCEVVDPLHTYAKVLVHVVQGDIYRIRVADGDSDTFDDNKGNLAYVLYAANYDEPTNDPTDNMPMFTVNGGDVCLMAVVSPGALSLTEISSLGTYLASWMTYVNLSFMRYLAWCDRHTNMFLSMMSMIEKREPFATLAEIEQMTKDIKANMKGYNWGSDSTDYSILTGDEGSFIGTLDEYLLGPMDSSSPWAGGDLVDLSVHGNPYSTTCSLAVTDYLGPILGKAMCFLVSVLNGTGMMFFVQLLLDLSTVFLVFTVMYNTTIDTISMFTGVHIPRIWKGGGSDGNNIPDMLRNLEKIQERREG